mgnify:CR=1 FL=1
MGIIRANRETVKHRPAAEQPGTFAEQFEAIGLFLATPWRRHDPREAWRLARSLAIPHAREVRR